MKNSRNGFLNAFVAILLFVIVIICYFIFYQKTEQPPKINDDSQNIEANNTSIKNRLTNIPIRDNQKEKNTVGSKYCFNSQCWKDNSEAIFKELFGEKLNAVSSNDPNLYKGDIVSGFYFDNKWLTACESLRQKVSSLVSNKSTDREKILAIANWVARSRQYGPLPAGGVNSICDLFNANGGVCLDAASLTTAMLRMADIPARVVDPKTDIKLAAHEYTATFLDGKWVAIDSTFGGGVREIFEPTSILSSLNYHAFDKPREIIIPTFNNTNAIQFTYYLADGIFTLTHTKNDLITENSVKTSESYGTITYIKPRYFSEGIGSISGANLIAKNLQCDYYECRKISGVETKILLPQEYTMINTKKMAHVYDGKVGQEITNQIVVNADLRKDYYVVTTYPAGKYRFLYESSTSGKAVAYYDFQLQQSGDVMITPDRLIKADGISNNEFSNFINYLKEVR